MELPYICNSGIADLWGSSLFGNFQQCLQLTNLPVEVGNLCVLISKQAIRCNLLFVHHADNHIGESLPSRCDKFKAIIIHMYLFVCSIFTIFLTKHGACAIF